MSSFKSFIVVFIFAIICAFIYRFMPSESIRFIFAMSMGSVMGYIKLYLDGELK